LPQTKRKRSPSASHAPPRQDRAAGVGSADPGTVDRAPSRAAVERAERGSKPYTAEHEAYHDGAVKRPTDPDQRASARARVDGRRVDRS
jgi:hypothetical protein